MYTRYVPFNPINTPSFELLSNGMTYPPDASHEASHDANCWTIPSVNVAGDVDVDVDVVRGWINIVCYIHVSKGAIIACMSGCTRQN